MNLAAGPSGAPAVTSATASLTHGQLRADTLGLRCSVPEGATVALRSGDPCLVAAALEALEGWASVVHLVGPDGAHVLPSGSVDIGDAALGRTVSSTAELPAAGAAAPTQWIVYTSGTTGTPKPVSHTRAGLARTAVCSERAAQLVWGLLYDANRMAGLQVLIQALTSGAHVVAPPLDAVLGDRLRILVEHGVDAISATPTLWRLALHLDPQGLELRQITLGGEIADQTTLDALARRFPTARILHIFASTETGAAFSVDDGRAGFPATYLAEAPRGVRLQIRDDILFVHAPSAGAAGPDGFASTGDVVEIVGDRVLFKGRSSGMVQVGGANVWPEQVEDALRDHPEVDDAVVRAKPNPVSGHILVAAIVPPAGVDTAGLARRVRRWARAELPNTHVPAIVEVVSRLDVSTTGKAVR